MKDIFDYSVYANITLKLETLAIYSYIDKIFKDNKQQKFSINIPLMQSLVRVNDTQIFSALRELQVINFISFFQIIDDNISILLNEI